MVLHETLLALVGHAGNIIVDRGDCFAVSDDITFLSEAEKHAVDRIVWLGWRFRELTRFVRRHASTGAAGNGGDGASILRSGLYLRALCAGVEAILVSYRARVAELEQQLLGDGGLPLSHVQCAMREQARTLPAVHDLAVEVDARGLHGGALLEELHRRAQSGYPLVRGAMARLQQRCLSVMLGHVGAWVGHGILSDQYAEFFIKHDDVDARARAAVAAGGVGGEGMAGGAAGGGVAAGVGAGLQHLANTAAHVSSVGAARGLLDISWGGAGAGAGAGSVGDDGGDGGGVHDSAVEAELTWHTAFTLRLEQLPLLFLPLRLADTVLFVGRAVQVLRKCDRLAEARGDPRPPLFSAKDAETFRAEVEALKAQPEWRLLAVQCALERMRALVARRLHELVVTHGRLLEHLAALRAFLLLGQGEFFQEFIVASLPMLSKLPSVARATQDINNGPFARAARSVGLESDAHWRRLRLHLHLPRFEFRSFGPTAEHEGLRLVGTASKAMDHSALALAAPPPAALATAAVDRERRGAAAAVAVAAARQQSAPAPGAPCRPLSGGGGSSWPAGAVWCADPKEVARSFTVGLEFQFTIVRGQGLGGGPATGLALVIQAHSSSALGACGAGLGYDGIPNSVAVEIDIACAPECHELSSAERGAAACRPPLGPHVAVHSCGILPNSARHGAALGVAALPAQSMPVGLSASAASSLVGGFGGAAAAAAVGGRADEPAPPGSASVADGMTHHLRIDYEPLPMDMAVAVGGGGMGGAVGAGQLRYGFRIFLDDREARGPPLLEVPINLPQTLALERTGGRAWLGVTASVGSEGALQQIAESSRAGVPQLKSWTFDGSSVGQGRGGGLGGGLARVSGGSLSASASGAAGADDDSVLDAWQGLELRYNVEWPLHLIVTQEALRRYNRMFSFLFVLKRASSALQRAWAIMMAPQYRNATRRTPDGRGSAAYAVLMRLWSLRARMAFLVSNLQYFAQVEVIDAQFHTLKEHIEAATDFESVRNAHNVYLAALTAKCYLNASSVRDAVKVRGIASSAQ